MRFLHTGDWHTGRAIKGRSRSGEFEAVFDELVAVAVHERVDAVLVAGDIYDGVMPTPDTDELVLDVFLRLRDAGIPVVSIAGNHDSAPRLAAWSRVLEAVGAQVVPKVVPPAEGGVREVPSRDGSETALVVCVPFVPERRFGSAAAAFDATEELYLSYAEGMGWLLSQMAEAFHPDRVNVLMAHVFIDGAIPGGGEREHTIRIGIEYAMSPGRLPGDATYIALGHVHKPQAVKGAPSPARYAGSLLHLDFGETGHDKSVTVVEAQAGKPARVKEVPLSTGRRLINRTGTLEELAAMKDSVGDAWIRAYVKTDGPVPGIADMVREHLPNAVVVVPEYARAERAEEGPSLSTLNPREQFLRYYREHYLADPDQGLMETFDEVLSLEQEGA